jgi:hypothetical protein
MKKILLVFTLTLALILSVFNGFSQSKAVTLEGITIESWDQIGKEYRYFDTKKADVVYFFDMETGAFIIINDYIVFGTYQVSFYTKKNKVIKQEDIDEMLDKKKVSYYIFESIETIDGNSYTIYLPYDLSYVKYIETENNVNYMYKFKVNCSYNGLPEIIKEIETNQK